MVISGDKDFEQLLELYEKGKTDELRSLLNSHMTTKTHFRGNNVHYDNIVTREMNSISIDSNFSDGNLNFNDYLNFGLDSTQTRPSRSFSNSSWLTFNVAGSGKQRSGRSDRVNRRGTTDSIGSMFDVRSRTGTTDSIGSMIDVNRTLSDDMFDNIVAQIADDGGFNYDEFSQGKPVVRMNTNKGILSSVQDEYYSSSASLQPNNLKIPSRHSLNNSSHDTGRRSSSNTFSSVGADLFNFDNGYVASNLMEDHFNYGNINPIPVYTNNNKNGKDNMKKNHRNSKNKHTGNGANSSGSRKIVNLRRRTRSSSEERQYSKRDADRLSGSNDGDPKKQQKNMIGKLTKEERRKRIDRWLEKRKHRNWSR